MKSTCVVHHNPRNSARRRRKPTETRNGQQLRRGDAHIATKARIAGHPSFSSSLSPLPLFSTTDGGESPPPPPLPPPPPSPSALYDGVRLGGEHYDRGLASMNECPIYTAHHRRCVFSVPERQGRFARTKAAGVDDSILPCGASEGTTKRCLRKQRGWLPVAITAAPRAQWRGNTIVTLDENDRCDFTLRKQ